MLITVYGCKYAFHTLDSRTMNEPLPMEIDPIDDGPKVAPPPPHESVLAKKELNVSQEDEARQAIDMLRGDDVSERVAAANRLEAVAVALGQERTREVGARGINYFVFALGKSQHASTAGVVAFLG